ncbi:MAG TPA: hypothetical protein VJV75_02585, partial [Candidatus Polarisedimenticolia bacterium]|nr:hypothetical protein [Candidatus Polarisedimenticolia bacterium]
MLVMLAAHATTGDFFYTSIALNLLLTAATLVIVGFRLARSPDLASLALAALFVSRAFLDYATGGLENPLAHLLLACLLWMLCDDVAPTAGRMFGLSIVAALLMTTRLDLAILVAPLCAQALWRRRTGSALLAAALGLLPLVAWEIFSLFYYGFLFPNTAYAKLGTGLSRLDMARHGLEYLVASLRLDPPTLPFIAAEVFFGLRSPARVDRAAGVGIVLYLAYIVAVGGDFMNGRFLTAPLLVAVVLLGRASIDGRLAVPLACALAVVFSLLPPTSPFRLEPDYPAGLEAPTLDRFGIADERVVYEEGGWLRNAPAEGPWPNPSSYRQAREILGNWADATWVPSLKFFGLMDENEYWPFLPPGPIDQSPLKPVIPRAAVGVLGFHLGARIHILDFLALGDPLLARMPALPVDPMLPTLYPRFKDLKYRVGHYPRRIPLGYYETLVKGKNLIRDPDLAAFYDHLAFIIQGPLWDRARLVEIWRMNTGRYDRLLREAVRRQPQTVPAPVNPPPP